MGPETVFPAGVIEGFYGPPWRQGDRLRLFESMQAWGLNTYFYAPKDDLHHRALWREPYGAADEQRLRDLIDACRLKGIVFVYGIGPGLDIQYGSDAELHHLQARFEQLLRAGCAHFAVLFDDIPADAGGTAKLGSLAAAQIQVANALRRWTRERLPSARFMFCPTPYCGRMAAAGLGGAGYLEEVGRGLDPAIDVFWTGPDIISREITATHAREVAAVLRRKPMIWDNLHANDYDGSRFFCGPYAGRAADLLPEISGLLSNPNVEFPLNYVPLRTLGWFVGRRMDDPRGAYLAAMDEWRASFATVQREIALDDLILFGDCFYLPYEEGPEGKALMRSAGLMIRGGAGGDAVAAFDARATRLQAFCRAVPELRDRDLCHALSRRVWALREELDLLERFAHQRGDAAVSSDFHRPGTYRGGIVARLQAMVEPRTDGTFVPAASTADDAITPRETTEPRRG